MSHQYNSSLNDTIIMSRADLGDLKAPLPEPYHGSQKNDVHMYDYIGISIVYTPYSKNPRPTIACQTIQLSNVSLPSGIINSY